MHNNDVFVSLICRICTYISHENMRETFVYTTVGFWHIKEYIYLGFHSHVFLLGIRIRRYIRHRNVKYITHDSEYSRRSSLHSILKLRTYTLGGPVTTW